MFKIKKMFMSLLCGVAMITGLTACSLSGPQPETNEQGQLMMQASASSFEDDNYESAIKRFKKYGFTNFKVNFMNDVILGLFVSEDGINSISINGKSNFEKGEYFDPTSVITMEVHSKHGGVFVDAKPYEGVAPIMYESTELNGENILTAAQSLKNIGFTNIEYVPVYDCSSQTSSSYNTVSGMTVAGKTMYYFYDCFAVDTPIKITYHTTLDSENPGESGENPGSSNNGGGSSQTGSGWWSQDYQVENGTFGIPGEIEFSLEKYTFSSKKIDLECGLIQYVIDSLTVSFDTKAIVYYLSSTEGYTECETTYGKVSSYKAYQNKKTTFNVSINVPNDSNIVAITAVEFYMAISGTVEGETMREDATPMFTWTCSATA